MKRIIALLLVAMLAFGMVSFGYERDAGSMGGRKAASQKASKTTCDCRQYFYIT